MIGGWRCGFWRLSPHVSGKVYKSIKSMVAFQQALRVYFAWSGESKISQVSCLFSFERFIPQFTTSKKASSSLFCLRDNLAFVLRGPSSIERGRGSGRRDAVSMLITVCEHASCKLCSAAPALADKCVGSCLATKRRYARW